MPHKGKNEIVFNLLQQSEDIQVGLGFDDHCYGSFMVWEIASKYFSWISSQSVMGELRQGKIYVLESYVKI